MGIKLARIIKYVVMVFRGGIFVGDRNYRENYEGKNTTGLREIHQEAIGTEYSTTTQIRTVYKERFDDRSSLR